jgi:hypothetical protein
MPNPLTLSPLLPDPADPAYQSSIQSAKAHQLRERIAAGACPLCGALLWANGRCSQWLCLCYAPEDQPAGTELS